MTTRAANNITKMEALLATFGPGVHSYRPFPRELGSEVSPSRLGELCRRWVVRNLGLRRLKRHGATTGLPPVLLRNLTVLSTEDFEELECAPLVDPLRGSTFLHRALTYRVRCVLDGEQYLAAWLGHEPGDRSWLDVDATHVMPIYACAMDSITGNIFAITELPASSLPPASVPEPVAWHILALAAEALLQLPPEARMQYGAVRPGDLFLVEGRLVLENLLTRKFRTGPPAPRCLGTLVEALVAGPPSPPLADTLQACLTGALPLEALPHLAEQHLGSCSTNFLLQTLPRNS